MANLTMTAYVRTYGHKVDYFNMAKIAAFATYLHFLSRLMD